MMDILDRWIDETPPVQQAQRFGNQAFRTFHVRLSEVCLSLPLIHEALFVVPHDRGSPVIKTIVV